MVSLKINWVLLTTSVALAVLVVMAGTLAEAKPAMDDVANMAEALKYLEQLDRFYAQAARPRFGRSVGASGSASSKAYLNKNPTLQTSSVVSKTPKNDDSSVSSR